MYKSEGKNGNKFWLMARNELHGNEDSMKDVLKLYSCMFNPAGKRAIITIAGIIKWKLIKSDDGNLPGKWKN